MHKAKLTSKGQITIPAPVREALQLKPGEKVAFLAGENGEFRLRRVGSIMEMYGCLAGLVPPMTLEEMDQAIADHVTESDDATRSNAKGISEGEAA